MMILFEPSNWTDAAVAIGTLLSVVIGSVALAAVFGVRRQLELQRKQLHRELESRYVDRYWSIADRLAASRGASHRRAIEAYLQLSDDEIELRKLGRVTDETWTYWCEAISWQMGEADFKAALGRFDVNRFQGLRYLVRVGSSFDPNEMSDRQRRRAGLT